eukprot:TRINITY_DN105407_c0_g1_i1.p1 TRINITY_DN105407_c0_g1~~TRINITY_DN105407_c0_g1_i1.p1  ORF type:complete len:1101 (+),score=239.35 TRINITY_DN105407_c0_g1_i1:77-3379(+)
MNSDRDRILDAYRAVGTTTRSASSSRSPTKVMQRTFSESQVPRFPALHTSSPVSQTSASWRTNSSPLKLPLLPDQELTSMEALAMAASAASEYAAAAAADVSKKYGMTRSRSAVEPKKRPKARAHILKLLSLSDDSNMRTTLQTNSETAGWQLHRNQIRPWGRTMPVQRQTQSPEEFDCLRTISKTAKSIQQICEDIESRAVSKEEITTEISPSAEQQGDLSSKNDLGPKSTHMKSKDNGSPKNTFSRQARNKLDAQAKARSRAAAEAEQQAWLRATLAAVPEADAETRTAAENRSRQQEQERQKNSAAEVAAAKAQQQGTEKKQEKTAESAGSRPTSQSKLPKQANRHRNSPVVHDVEEEEAYGFPDLQERIDRHIDMMVKGNFEISQSAIDATLRPVFNRFRSQGGDEVSKEDMPNLIQYLGFVVPDIAELMKVVDSQTEFNEIDFTDFLEICEKYARIQYQRYRDTFASFDTDSSGEIEISELRALLTELGFVVVRQMIEETLQAVDEDKNGSLNFEELVRFVSVYGHSEGFTKQEVRRLFQVYGSFVNESQKLSPKNKGLQCNELQHALIAFFGLYSQHHAIRLGKSLTTNPSGSARNQEPSSGLSFHEFLICSRRLREAEQRDYKAGFHKHDKDNSGKIDVSELHPLLQELGYKPLRAVVDEVLEEVDYEADAELDYEELFHFLLIFKQRDGFTKRELEQCNMVFHKYDHDKSDSIDAHELGDMLRFLGYNVPTEDVYTMMAQVDHNRNGDLDLNEFLRLMRLHRESYMERLQVIFDEHALGKKLLPKASIFSAVQAASGEDSNVKHVKDATAGKMELDIDFEDFVELANQAHWLKAMEKRRLAGFTEADLDTLRETFNHYDKDGSGDIDSFEVQDLLNDFGLPIRTTEERQAVLERIEMAKELAIEAGVPRDISKDNAMMTFWELVQLVRLVKTARAKEEEERSSKIIASLHFSRQETEDFRAIFLSWARTGGAAPIKESTALGTRMSFSGSEQQVENLDPHDLFESGASLSIALFQKLLKSLGLTITQQLKQKLEARLQSSAELTDKGELSFPGFLQMMRWMLDSNFAGINGAAQKVAKSSQEAHFAKELNRK